MNNILWGIIACGALSILYAIITIQSVMKADAGTPRMQEIAANIREGAQAYLNRQYTTIGMVGIVIFVLALVLLVLLLLGGGFLLLGAFPPDAKVQSIQKVLSNERFQRSN